MESSLIDGENQPNKHIKGDARTSRALCER